MENVTGECRYVYNSPSQKSYFLFEISSKKSIYCAKTAIMFMTNISKRLNDICYKSCIYYIGIILTSFSNIYIGRHIKKDK